MAIASYNSYLRVLPCLMLVEASPIVDLFFFALFGKGCR